MIEWARAIDVSTWQDDSNTARRIDWTKPREQGVRLVINRAVFGHQVDDDFGYNWAEQKRLGYYRGAYGFWDYRPGAASTEEQARALVNALKGDPGEFPVVWMDVERPLSTWPALPNRDYCLTQIRRYTLIVEEALGKEVGVYMNPAMIQYLRSVNGMLVNLPDWLRAKALWIAAWPSPPDGEKLEDYIERKNWRPNLYGQWSRWLMWQIGVWDGLAFGMESREVDANFIQMTDAELDELCGGTTEEPGGAMWEDNALIAAFDKIGSNAEITRIDYAALKAAGLDAVLVNLGTSSDHLNYDEPYAGAIDNNTRYARLAAARAAGLIALGEYNYSPVMDSVNSYNGRWVLQHINYVTSGAGKPDGAVILTCERYKWWESTREVTCVPTMYAQDLRAVQSAIWGAHHLVAGIRTGRWFLDASKVDFASIMDPLYYPEEVAPLFMAYWMKSNAVVGGNFHDIVKDIPDPAVTTVNAGGVAVNLQAHFLYTGNHAKWRGWECATVKHAAVTDAAGNMVPFRLILWRGTPEELAAYFNLSMPEPADTQPPSAPGNLAALYSDGQVGLVWAAASDNVGVKGYRVFRDGNKIGETVELGFGDDPTAGAHVYGVEAYDAAGNTGPRATLEVLVPEEDETVIDIDLERVRAALHAGVDAFIEGLKG